VEPNSIVALIIRMIDFLPQILVLVGLSGSVALLVRKSRYIPEEGLRASFETIERARAWWRVNFVARFPKEELEDRVLCAAEKLLRRGRIAAMRTDFLFLRWLEGVRRTRTDKHVPRSADYWTEFAKPELRHTPEDLFEAELRLGANPLFATYDEYRKLAEVYLAKDEFSDARRLLLEAWRRAPQATSLLPLFMQVQASVEHGGAGADVAQR